MNGLMVECVDLSFLFPFDLFFGMSGVYLSNQVDEGLIVRWWRPSWQRLAADRSEPWEKRGWRVQMLRIRRGLLFPALY